MFELGSKTSNRLASEDRYASLGVLGNNEIVIEGFLFQSFETYDELLDSVHKSEKDHRNRNRVQSWSGCFDDFISQPKRKIILPKRFCQSDGDEQVIPKKRDRPFKNPATTQQSNEVNHLGKEILPYSFPSNLPGVAQWELLQPVETLVLGTEVTSLDASVTSRDASPKKKLGRPFKVKSQLENNVTDNSNSNNANGIISQPDPPKKKLGHLFKMKSQLENNFAYDNYGNKNSIINQSDPPKKKLGRPSKFKSQLESNIMDNCNNNNHMGVIQQTDVPKTKLGFPLQIKSQLERKIAYTNYSNIVSSPYNINNQCDPPKKKRGRPLKIQDKLESQRNIIGNSNNSDIINTKSSSIFKTIKNHNKSDTDHGNANTHSYQSEMLHLRQNKSETRKYRDFVDGRDCSKTREQSGIIDQFKTDDRSGPLDCPFSSSSKRLPNQLESRANNVIKQQSKFQSISPKTIKSHQDSGKDIDRIELHVYKSMTSGILVKINPETMMAVNQVGKCYLRGRPVQQLVDEGLVYFCGKVLEQVKPSVPFSSSNSTVTKNPSIQENRFQSPCALEPLTKTSATTGAKLASELNTSKIEKWPTSSDTTPSPGATSTCSTVTTKPGSPSGLLSKDLCASICKDQSLKIASSASFALSRSKTDVPLSQLSTSFADARNKISSSSPLPPLTKCPSIEKRNENSSRLSTSTPPPPLTKSPYLTSALTQNLAITSFKASSSNPTIVQPLPLSSHSTLKVISGTTNGSKPNDATNQTKECCSTLIEQSLPPSCQSTSKVISGTMTTSSNLIALITNLKKESSSTLTINTPTLIPSLKTSPSYPLIEYSLPISCQSTSKALSGTTTITSNLTALLTN